MYENICIIIIITAQLIYSASIIQKQLLVIRNTCLFYQINLRCSDDDINANNNPRGTTINGWNGTHLLLPLVLLCVDCELCALHYSYIHTTVKHKTHNMLFCWRAKVARLRSIYSYPQLFLINFFFYLNIYVWMPFFLIFCIPLQERTTTPRY